MLTEKPTHHADGLLTSAHLPAVRVSEWVERWLSGRPPGRLLDLACGAGRHARWAADRGHQVLAIDRDAQALAGLVHERIHPVQEDLEHGPWSLGSQGFDVILCTNYLHRPRLALLLTLLAPGGLWIHETFAVGNAAFGRPRNPEFLLQGGELLHWAARAGLQVLGYENGLVGDPANACIQRIAAVRDPSPHRLAPARAVAF
jgi:SAM-dependent methyltransferase